MSEHYTDNLVAIFLLFEIAGCLADQSLIALFEKRLKSVRLSLESFVVAYATFAAIFTGCRLLKGEIFRFIG